MAELTLHEITPKIAELIRKMRQTANRSLRQTYADQAKILLDNAERISNKNNVEEQAGVRKLRNDLIQILDTQFPLSQRKEHTKALESKETPMRKLACSFGFIEGDTTVNEMPKWYVLAGIALLCFALGRTTKQVYRRMRRK